ncbi:MAG: hypothetical protein HY553_21675 [Elusimicrobia bacterium]|nr:hypothetical protein [Elusimicrobiota bacterium]
MPDPSPFPHRRLAALAVFLLAIGFGVESRRRLFRAGSSEGGSGGKTARPSRAPLGPLSGLSMTELESLLTGPRGAWIAERLTEELLKDAALRARWERLAGAARTPAGRLAAMLEEPGFAELLRSLEKDPSVAAALAGRDRLSARLPSDAAGPTRFHGGPIDGVAQPSPALPAQRGEGWRERHLGSRRAGTSTPPHPNPLPRSAGEREELKALVSANAAAQPSRPGSGRETGATIPLANMNDAESERMRRLLEVYPWLGRLSSAERERILGGIDGYGLWGSCFMEGLYARCMSACSGARGSCVPLAGWNACLEAIGDSDRCRALCAAQPGCVAGPPSTTPPPEPVPAPCPAGRVPPYWGEKGGMCLPSCSSLGGTFSGTSVCPSYDLRDAGSAFDADYCCKPICDPTSQPYPHFGPKNGQCLKSCGGIGGTHNYDEGCEVHGLMEIGPQFDVQHCCVVP